MEPPPTSLSAPTRRPKNKPHSPQASPATSSRQSSEHEKTMRSTERMPAAHRFRTTTSRATAEPGSRQADPTTVPRGPPPSSPHAAGDKRRKQPSTTAVSPPPHSTGRQVKPSGRYAASDSLPPAFFSGAHLGPGPTVSRQHDQSLPPHAKATRTRTPSSPAPPKSRAAAAEPAESSSSSRLPQPTSSFASAQPLSAKGAHERTRAMTPVAGCLRGPADVGVPGDTGVPLAAHDEDDVAVFVRSAAATLTSSSAAAPTSTLPVAHEATAAQRSEDGGAPCDDLLAHHIPDLGDRMVYHWEGPRGPADGVTLLRVVHGAREKLAVLLPMPQATAAPVQVSVVVRFIAGPLPAAVARAAPPYCDTQHRRSASTLDTSDDAAAMFTLDADGEAEFAAGRTVIEELSMSIDGEDNEPFVAPHGDDGAPHDVPTSPGLADDAISTRQARRIDAEADGATLATRPRPLVKPIAAGADRADLEQGRTVSPEFGADDTFSVDLPRVGKRRARSLSASDLRFLRRQGKRRRCAPIVNSVIGVPAAALPPAFRDEEVSAAADSPEQPNDEHDAPSPPASRFAEPSTPLPTAVAREGSIVASRTPPTDLPPTASLVTSRTHFPAAAAAVAMSAFGQVAATLDSYSSLDASFYCRVPCTPLAPRSLVTRSPSSPPISPIARLARCPAPLSSPFDRAPVFPPFTPARVAFRARPEWARSLLPLFPFSDEPPQPMVAQSVGTDEPTAERSLDASPSAPESPGRRNDESGNSDDVSHDPDVAAKQDDEEGLAMAEAPVPRAVGKLQRTCSGARCRKTCNRDCAHALCKRHCIKHQKKHLDQVAPCGARGHQLPSDEKGEDDRSRGDQADPASVSAGRRRRRGGTKTLATSSKGSKLARRK